MVLCIDAGNSSVKFCVFDEKGRHGAVHVEPLEGPSRSWEAILQSAVDDPLRVRGAIISSVVPALTDEIARAAERACRNRPLLVEDRLHFPFRIAVPHPETIGADRLCCAAGAVGRRRFSSILIDIGSAVTVDLLLDSEFKGGIIMAGPGITLRALAQNTQKLPLLAFPQGVDDSIRRFDSTEESMRLGARLNALGGIREAVRYLDRAAGRPVVKILTGGAATALSPSLPRSWRRDPNLVLKGLYRLWQLNSAVY